MVIHVSSFTFLGIETREVDVQIHMANGIPCMQIVGLPDKIVAESKERIKAAISSLGLEIPLKRITVNLAPADLSKEGSHFDLPIAVGILASMNIIPKEELAEYFVLGELGLDGAILPISGSLPAAVGAVAMQKNIICPEANGKEAAWAGDLKILAPNHLLALINHFKGKVILPQPQPELFNQEQTYLDMIDIRGQESAKRALIIAACGNHNMLMSGPPGAGKSMLASRLPGILPEMDAKEMLECSMIASVAGQVTDGKLTTVRPFRAPHHSLSMAAMIGGGMGKRINPGEITLAHNGVLFLDELPEFQRAILESLRQPLETGSVLVARAHSHITFPANFMLVAAMNPCRCGYLTDPARACNKAPKCGEDYQGKLSGPLLDRIDLHIDVEPNNEYSLYNSGGTETSKQVAAKVQEVRDLQRRRYEKIGIRTNSELNGKMLEELINIDNQAMEYYNKAAEKLKISMRSYSRMLKVARTIADMENERVINTNHVAEALNYRQPLLRKPAYA